MNWTKTKFSVWAATILFNMIVVRAILNRIFIFFDEVYKGQNMQATYGAMYAECEANPMMRKTFSNCQEADNYMKKVGSAYWHAARTVMDMTHSCIEMPCFDILDMILNSWVSFFIAVLIVAIYFQAAVAAAKSGWQKYQERKVQKKKNLLEKLATAADASDMEYSVLMEDPLEKKNQ